MSTKKYKSSSLQHIVDDNYTLPNLSDLWIETFSYLKNNKNFDNTIVSKYADAIKFNSKLIQQKGGVQSKISNRPLIIPIIFHALVDDPSFLSPFDPSQDNKYITPFRVTHESKPSTKQGALYGHRNIYFESAIKFNVKKIIHDINKAFYSSGIQFKPVTINLGADGDGTEVLQYPGLNLINASSLIQYRSYAPASMEYEGETFDRNYYNRHARQVNLTELTSTNIHSYSLHGVAPKKNIAYNGTKNSNHYTQCDGITIDALHKAFAWNEEHVLNVFLINDFSKTYDDLRKIDKHGIKVPPVVYSSSPFLYDISSLSNEKNKVNYSVVIPYWALGKQYQSEENQGYGYSYEYSKKANFYKQEYGFPNPNLSWRTDPETGEPIKRNFTYTTNYSPHYINSLVSDTLSLSGSGENTYGNIKKDRLRSNVLSASALVNALGHMLGLENRLNYIPTFPSKSSNGQFKYFNYFTNENFFGFHNDCEGAVNIDSSIFDSNIYNNQFFYNFQIDSRIGYMENLNQLDFARMYAPLAGDLPSNKMFSLPYDTSMYTYEGQSCYDSYSFADGITRLNFMDFHLRGKLFSQEQAIQIHANIDLNYTEIHPNKPNVVFKGVLKKLTHSNVPTLSETYSEIEGCKSSFLETYQQGNTAYLEIASKNYSEEEFILYTNAEIYATRYIEYVNTYNTLNFMLGNMSDEQLSSENFTTKLGELTTFTTFSQSLSSDTPITS